MPSDAGLQNPILDTARNWDGYADSHLGQNGLGGQATTDMANAVGSPILKGLSGASFVHPVVELICSRATSLGPAEFDSTM